MAALHSSLAEGIFNITDEPIRNGDYLDGLAERLGLPAPPRNPDIPRPRSYRYSSAAACEALGWNTHAGRLASSAHVGGTHPPFCMERP